MGRVRTKTVKKASKVIIEKYFQKLTQDFQTNKKVICEIAIIPSVRLRNKIAGFATHLMKRIARGPVRGISLKLQEEEREKRMDFAPEVSQVDQQILDQGIEVDDDTMAMLNAMDMGGLSHLRKVQTFAPTQNTNQQRGGRGRN
uniref:40S ribosomal protein S17 n=1 Tax=Eutreptiella gymnastica TaxID=73025 RepID=A0A7S1IWL7_9EUGL|mmetsp:Transcript_49077/g.87546  ORF Transcript_49077/g.87546 Transcript_49077/m.87546 type:complete len:144 (+) Transcript_49077:61-492(+)